MVEMWASELEEDFFVLLSSTLAVATGILCLHVQLHLLLLHRMQHAQLGVFTPDDPEWIMRINGSKTQLIGWNLYVLLLWSLKTCMAIFYSRPMWVTGVQ
jgi:hypothetical protein